MTGSQSNNKTQSNQSTQSTQNVLMDSAANIEPLLKNPNQVSGENDKERQCFPCPKPFARKKPEPFYVGKVTPNIRGEGEDNGFWGSFKKLIGIGPRDGVPR